MNEKTKLRNDIVRISVLEEEIEIIKSNYTEHDTGHLRTAVSVLEHRVKQLRGIKTDDIYRN